MLRPWHVQLQQLRKGSSPWLIASQLSAVCSPVVFDIYIIVKKENKVFLCYILVSHCHGWDWKQRDQVRKIDFQGERTVSYKHVYIYFIMYMATADNYYPKLGCLVDFFAIQVQ